MKYKTFSEAVEVYLKERRSMGYSLERRGEQLCNFAKYADKIGHKGPLTTELALQWVRLPQKCQVNYWAQRLSTIRVFAKYMQLLDPKTQIPPKGLFGTYYHRPIPHIYSKEEITIIIKAARKLTPVTGLYPHTYVTLFGLLLCSGIRIFEALKLSRDDIDFNSGILTVIEGKFKRSRLVPLHSTALKPLKSYIKKVDKKFPIPQTKAFFVNERGKRLGYNSAWRIFHQIILNRIWNKKTNGSIPRIYDLRHTFATYRLLEWHRNGDDVAKKINQLSTYMGHVSIQDTYWYLSAIPELMDIIGTRFEKFVNRKEVVS